MDGKQKNGRNDGFSVIHRLLQEPQEQKLPDTRGTLQPQVPKKKQNPKNKVIKIYGEDGQVRI